MKADNSLVNESISSMNLMYKQLGQSVIILVESLKNLAPSAGKTENTTHRGYNFLLKQASSLLKWMNAKGLDDTHQEEANLNPDETPKPITITAFPSSGFSTSRVDIAYKDAKLSTSFGKGKTILAEDEKHTTDERVKSRLHNLPHMYSKNKLLIKKRHRLRETIGTFDFKNRRKSALDVYDKYNSIDKYLKTPIVSLHEEESKFLTEEF